MRANPGLESGPLSAVMRELATFADFERTPPAGDRRAFNLDRVRDLLAGVGDPHLGRAGIHVTGTKGKGSTTHFADAILRAHGLKTFRFVSPHIERLNERIAIGGLDVSDETLGAALAALRPGIDSMRAHGPEEIPTFFEVMTAIGFWVARQNAVDADVVEVGLGGRLDATNVIEPTVSVITGIDLEHTSILGTTREQIAAEKAGIVKPATPVLVGLDPRDPAGAVILSRARVLGAPASCLGDGIEVAGATLSRTGSGRPAVRFRGRVGSLVVEDAMAPGGGIHQAGNALLALGAAARVLAALGRRIDVHAAQSAIEATDIPARAELFGARPPVLLDVAHTGRSCAALADLARWLFGDRRIVLLAGLTRERSVRALFSPLLETASEAVFAPLPNPRTADPAAAAAEWASLGGRARSAHDPLGALELARASAGAGGAVVVAGSCYLAGAIRPALRNLV